MSIATLKRKNAALKGRTTPNVAWKTSNSSHRTARIGRCCPAIVYDPSQASNVYGIGSGAEHTSYETVNGQNTGAHIECGEDTVGGEDGACALNHVTVGGRHVPYRNTVKHLDKNVGRAHAAASYDDYIRALKNKSC